MRTFRILVIVLLVLVASIGVLALPMTAVSLGVGGLAVGWAYALARGEASSSAAAPGLLARGVRASAALIGASYVLTGLVVLFGATAAVAVLIAAAPLAAWWFVADRRRPAPAAPVEPRPAAPPRAVVRAVPLAPPSPAGLSTPELCLAWRSTYAMLAAAAGPTTLDEIARARQCYLDELERRDPAGFRRWMESGARAASDPGKFIGRRDDDRPLEGERAA